MKIGFAECRIRLGRARGVWAAAGVLVLLLMGMPAWAMFMQPSLAPVDRLAENARAYVQENPQDAHGHYVLGRIHYLAWSLKSDQVPHMDRVDEAGRPRMPDNHLVRMSRHRVVEAEAERRVLEEMELEQAPAWGAPGNEAYIERLREVYGELQEAGWTPAVDEAELDEHAEQAMRHLRSAIELDPEKGLYHLGLGSLAEEYAERAGERELAFADEAVEDEAQAKGQWQQGALESYRRAFALAREEDAAHEHQPVEGVRWLVSYEAAQGYERVAQAMREQAGDEQVLAAMREHKQALDELPVRVITPIVFSFQRHDGLDDLIDDQASVAFDLDGTGREQRWTWPRQDTGILVWDPLESGEITSGKQLFGSVTWWVLPGDGYRALDLLDNNRDGKLTGDELAGLAVWFDREGDGVSHAGQVIPVRELGIEAIAVEAVSQDGDALMNPRGVKLGDGTWVPSYDWLAESAE